ncbi:Jlp1p [Sugiyamaella lignohabitans]|uniref:Jlp1p n=1 Tax=Sugiyamaella lignohabitans TaxID=796027 RepID=A0A167FLD8_9ASCO|nr:Jlp1p [Sugiyamaella lignohabitans]ANB15445.1 Jlp1p [Sugiyamaella lignohabitans]
MAPTAETQAPLTPNKGKFLRGVADINEASLARLSLREKKEKITPYEFEHLSPAYPDIHWEPLKELEYTDKALGADEEYKELFKAVTSYRHVTPKFGTVLEGVNLAELNDKQKAELAHLTAYRGVIFFRDQKDLDIHKQLDLGRFWGKLHKHATTALPRDWEKGLDEVHVVFANEYRPPSQAYPQSYLWHSDVSYELQPPAYTTLKLLDGPEEAGGDTLWISGYGLYDALSPGLKEYVEKHTALHSAHEQADGARANGKTVRRDPIVTEHPLVRVHPVTGYKSLYVNPGFTRSIVGVPKAESDAILQYLFSLIATSQEYTARFTWGKHDLALWDNRVTVHSATYGFYPNRRHAVRVTVHGETPYYDPNGKSQQEEIDAQLQRKTYIDGSKGINYND